MTKLLLLLLGWAVIGHGMWYSKGGIRKQDFAKLGKLRAFSARLVQQADEIFYELVKYETEKIIKEQPQDSIKIKFHNSGLPDCHLPYTIINKHKRPADSITDLIFCSTDKRVHAFATFRKNIRVTFIICANEQMCKESFIRKGVIQKLDNQLYIVPPQFEDKFVSCCIEHPIDQEFNFEKMSFAKFMEKFDVQKTEPITSDDSSGSDFLSSEEDSEQE